MFIIFGSAHNFLTETSNLISIFEIFQTPPTPKMASDSDAGTLTGPSSQPLMELRSTLITDGSKVTEKVLIAVAGTFLTFAEGIVSAKTTGSEVERTLKQKASRCAYWTNRLKQAQQNKCSEFTCRQKNCPFEHGELQISQRRKLKESNAMSLPDAFKLPEGLVIDFSTTKSIAETRDNFADYTSVYCSESNEGKMVMFNVCVYMYVELTNLIESLNYTAKQSLDLVQQDLDWEKPKKQFWYLFDKQSKKDERCPGGSKHHKTNCYYKHE